MYKIPLSSLSFWTVTSVHMLGSVICVMYENVCDITKLSTMLSHVSYSFTNKLNNISQTVFHNSIISSYCLYLFDLCSGNARKTFNPAPFKVAKPLYLIQWLTVHHLCIKSTFNMNKK